MKAKVPTAHESHQVALAGLRGSEEGVVSRAPECWAEAAPFPSSFLHARTLVLVSLHLE